MLFARLAALTLAALVFWGAAASAGGPLRPFRYGFWSGGAYIDQRTGAFTHCSAGVAYDSGVNLFVLVTGEYSWWLGFINPKWSFTSNANASVVRLRVDKRPPFDLHATVPNGQLLLIPLPDNSHLIDAFRNGAELALDAEGQTLFFRLNETPGMMDRLTACVRTSLALEGTKPPAGSQSAIAPQPVVRPEASAAASSRQFLPPAPPGGGPTLAPPPPAASLTRAHDAHDAAKPAVPAPAKSTDAAAAAPSTAEQAANTPAASVEAPAVPIAAPKRSGMVPNVGPPLSSSLSAASTSSSEKDASAPYAAAAAKEPPAASIAKSSAPQTAPSPPGEPAALSTDGVKQSVGGSANRSIAALPPAQATASNPLASPQMSPPPSGRPPLAFTAVNPMTSAPPPALSPLAAQPAAGTALEEVRLATQFLTNARLPDAHLIIADKPPALADFAAVWRSEDAAGAVKIIPPGPDVSAVAIASNLITVDPQVCKGDFTSARLRTDVANHAVFSAVLTCNEANEERVTQYLIVSRQRGGFVVFAVIRSNEAGRGPDLGRQNLEALSRAAIQAVAGQG